MSTAVDAAKEEGTNAMSLNTAGKAFPREEQSTLHQGRFKPAAKGTKNAPEHPADAAKDGATARDDGNGRGYCQNDAAKDGVVFMVYAKRW